MFSASSWAQEKLTLENAIELAMENNYGIKIAKGTQQIAENNYTLGNAGFLPTVTLSANQNNSLVNGEQIVGGDVRDIDNQENKSTTIGGNINWTIFDGTRMFVNYDILKSQNIQSQEALDFAIQTTIYNVATNYYLAALEKERLKLLQSNLELSEDRLKIAKDKYELGKGSKLEYLQAQVDYNTDQSNILSQKQVLENQKLELVRQMNAKSESEFDLDNTLLFDRNITLDDLLNSIQTNKELNVLERAKEIAELQEKASKADRLPNLSVFAGYNYSETQRAVGFTFESSTTDLSYGFNASVTLFNGFNINRVIQNTKINKEIAELNYEQRMFDLETSIRQQFLSYLNSIELINIEEKNVAVAKENNEIAKERYDIGLSNPVEYRESQTNLIAAETRKQNAEYSAKLAEIQLKYLAGIRIK
ncbi:TolC family protein [Fulvivirga lutea]|uniref:TolC family protein n=1 Tax=Fulvivirga lutea TaxID=2810512 RepID=A0A974WE76_9BACT|nr:TolC family protein [Fulvivirga lutea]QSE96643.1 TolC family protein [Fulvivirga lutea]